MRKIARRFLVVPTMLMALFVALPGVAFAAPHMACCLTPHASMICCIVNAAMQCCHF